MPYSRKCVFYRDIHKATDHYSRKLTSMGHGKSDCRTCVMLSKEYQGQEFLALAYHVAFHHDGLKTLEAGEASTTSASSSKGVSSVSKQWHFKCVQCTGHPPFKCSETRFRDSEAKFKVHVSTAHVWQQLKREAFTRYPKCPANECNFELRPDCPKSNCEHWEAGEL